MSTTWGSRNAEDMFRIATRLAGFNGGQLMVEINRRQRGRDSKVNEATVLAAMQTLEDRAPRDGQREQERVDARARLGVAEERS